MTTELTITADDRQLLANLSEEIGNRELGEGREEAAAFWKRAGDLVSRLSAGLPAPTPHVFVRVDGGLVQSCNARGAVEVTVLDEDCWECVSRSGEHWEECPDHTPAEFEDWLLQNAEADSLPQIPC